MMGTLIQDLRYSFRTLRKSPVFTLVAVVALALGIGANTAIFSVVNAVLLRSLPFPAPERLVGINCVNAKKGDELSGASPADFLDWKAQNNSFEAVAAYSGGGMTLTGGDAPEQIAAARVTEDFFKVFGVQPALGRTFAPDEHLLRASSVVVLSQRMWQTRFGGDPSIVGKTLTLNGEPTTVIGVMPPEFKEPAFAELWTPLAKDSGEMRPRDARYFNVAARLKPNVTREQAQTEMDVLASRLEAQHPETNAGWKARLIPLQERGITQVRRALFILLAAVGFVLLIACVNVASLLLARAAARQREVAIRTALGATRTRIVRQFLVESVILSLIGGGAGLLLALWGVETITKLIPEDWRFPRLEETRVDATVLAFTFGVSALTGLLFGLLPALKASKPDLYASLKESGKSATQGLRLLRLRGALVVTEIALALVLLVGAGLLVKSFVRLNHVDPGFDPQNVLTFNVSPPLSKKYMDDGARVELFRQILEQVSTLPGVESVASNSGPPLASFGLNFAFQIEGRPIDASEKRDAFYSSISPGYFQTLRIPLVSGRDFSERDSKDAPPIVIINETMSRHFFPAGDAIGKRIKIHHYMIGDVSHEIVGVARDATQMALGDEVKDEMFVPALQYPWLSTVFVVRAKSDAASLIPSLQRAVAAVDKNLPVARAKTMDQLFAETTSQPRFYALLLSVFAAVALVLASVGIYGVTSYSVAQRTNEIGIRMTLGAQGRDVLRMILGQGILLTLAGVALGLAGAFALTRVMSGLLFGVGASDPLTFASVSLLLVCVALLACFIPARRATKVDPMIALRNE